MSMKSVTVTITGERAAGKTVLACKIARLCEERGIEWHPLTGDVYPDDYLSPAPFPLDTLVQIQTKQDPPTEPYGLKPGTWVQYTARNGEHVVKRAIRLTDSHAIAAALRCQTDDGCLDIFSSAYEYDEGSDWWRVATWSFHLGDLHRLGLAITAETLTDEEHYASLQERP